MRLPSLLSILPLSSALTITLHISPSHHTSGGQSTFPPNTHATLSTLGAQHSAYLTPAGEFVFRNVSEGSYLADVHCATYAFSPVRVDVAEGEGGKAVVQAWETYRGNEWDNKGEVRVGEGGRVEVRVLGGKQYFVERQKFSVFTILKNPMILLGLVSMGLFIGMPYLVDNMDPEMKAEFEERQRNNPMNSILGGQQPGANPMGNFDMAAYLAGTNKKEGNGRGGNGGVRR
ncbi:hypothetical protein SAPIO_CDS5174 [Scedosporium apiospermum]|uniref:ER membrane protein complex subunit 7 beta-sandwich domain-containing protein n=1 Tax=Pseudallescheria apiosperma TaxID=563466 RepID=A0A084G6X5_PSEDA|nr:uncharacterized protein SAPIO_CDS5174 [Scedosporium apiospermum]KEZ43087.1 hypothetical protein SAPIO_CDS5174 [Scedosporium apiospermum]